MVILVLHVSPQATLYFQAFDIYAIFDVLTN